MWYIYIYIYIYIKDKDKLPRGYVLSCQKDIDGYVSD
jgi:hypothetical protein